MNLQELTKYIEESHTEGKEILPILLPSIKSLSDKKSIYEMLGYTITYIEENNYECDFNPDILNEYLKDVKTDEIDEIEETNQVNELRLYGDTTHINIKKIKFTLSNEARLRAGISSEVYNANPSIEKSRAFSMISSCMHHILDEPNVVYKTNSNKIIFSYKGRLYTTESKIKTFIVIDEETNLIIKEKGLIKLITTGEDDRFIILEASSVSRIEGLVEI